MGLITFSVDICALWQYQAWVFHVTCSLKKSSPLAAGSSILIQKSQSSESCSPSRKPPRFWALRGSLDEKTGLDRWVYEHPVGNGDVGAFLISIPEESSCHALSDYSWLPLGKLLGLQPSSHLRHWNL